MAGLPDHRPDNTGSVAAAQMPSTEVDWRRDARSLGRALPQGSEGRRSRPFATRRRCAPPVSAHRLSRYWSRPQSTIRNNTAVARRLWPRACGYRKFRTGARRAWPRAHARSAGLAHSFGAGCRARPDGPARGSTPPLHQSALQIVPDEPSVMSNLGLSYALSKNLKRSRADLAARQRLQQPRAARAAESRAGGRLAGPFPGGRANRTRRSVARRGAGQSRLSEADAGRRSRPERRASRPQRVVKAGRCKSLP